MMVEIPSSWRPLTPAAFTPAHGDPNAEALAEIADRLAWAAIERRYLTYRSLAFGFPHRLPDGTSELVQPRPGEPVRSKHIAILDDYLSALSFDAYKVAEIVPSALVLHERVNEPSTGFLAFCTWMKLWSGRPTIVYATPRAFWQTQAMRTYSWFNQYAKSSGLRRIST